MVGQIKQPPSGGCVLKLILTRSDELVAWKQPPSGGCVLKLYIFYVFLVVGGSRLRAAVC